MNQQALKNGSFRTFINVENRGGHISVFQTPGIYNINWNNNGARTSPNSTGQFQSSFAPMNSTLIGPFSPVFNPDSRRVPVADSVQFPGGSRSFNSTLSRCFSPGELCHDCHHRLYFPRYKF